jgi:hypothetical protein
MQPLPDKAALQRTIKMPDRLRPKAAPIFALLLAAIGIVSSADVHGHPDGIVAATGTCHTPDLGRSKDAGDGRPADGGPPRPHARAVS